MTLALLTALTLGATALPAQERPPVLDMHMHALGADEQGHFICAPFDSFPAWDQREAYGEVFALRPPCDDPLVSPPTDASVRDGTIDVMERLNVFGVLSGSLRRVDDWQRSAPGRFIRGLAFQVGSNAPSPDSLGRLVRSGAVEVLAEVTNQYAGLEPGAEAMAPYWDVAEELDLPVGIHMGPGPPGVAYLGASRYRAALGNPLLLEDVLAAHPRLRLYVMHAGYPFLDDMNALLYAHPQVFVEVGVIVFTRPRNDFYRYLQGMVEAGFGDRIMFGSDHMNWPGALERAVQVIEDAPFLDPGQKRAILYGNAARFLRLGPDEQDRHRGAERAENAPGAAPLWELRWAHEAPGQGLERVVVEKDTLFLEAHPVVSDRDVLAMRARVEGRHLAFDVRLSPEGAETLARDTRENVGARLALLFESTPLSAPRVNDAVGGRIQGRVRLPSEAQAERLQTRIEAHDWGSRESGRQR